jgi:hypothetical protein
LRHLRPSHRMGAISCYFQADGQSPISDDPRYWRVEIWSIS